MPCPTLEQLAATALGVPDDAAPPSHIDQCVNCQEKLVVLRELTTRLALIHSDLNHRLAASRNQLLASLRNPEAPVAKSRLKAVVNRLNALPVRQRVAAVGIGLSALAATVLAVAVIANFATPLSAMERMAKQLREVTSFSFELEETSDRISGDNRRRIRRNDTNYWVSPASWRGTTRLVKLPLPPAPGDAGELLVDVEEIYTPGQRGILIDHKNKTFFRTPEMQPDGFPDYSPVNWVQRMSKGNIRVTDDLGTKELNSRMAHGYVVSLGHPEPDNGQNAIHVWLDPETDLPIEFRYEESHSDEGGRWTNVMRVFNCRWNVQLDASPFQPAGPAGYDDTSWPGDENEVVAMVEALSLYAELSGGHYPRITDFRGEKVRDEMMQLAGFTGPPQPEWNNNALFQRIKRSAAGLASIARTLRNKHHTGYYGMEVGPDDNEKALMWWPVDVEDSYQVVFGDLRTEILPLADWAKLVPPDVAESHMPVHYAKPGTSR